MNNESNEDRLEHTPRKKIIKSLIAGAIILVIIITGFIILINKDTQIDELHVETHRLDEIIHQRDSVISELDGAISEIEQNISYIKTRRETLEFEYSESSKSRKDKIIDDIKLMNDLLAESEKKLEELNQKLQDSDIEISSFRKRISVISSELQSQTKIVASLKEELEKKDAMLAEMGQKVEKLESVLVVHTDSLTALTDSVERTTQLVKEFDQQLHKAYWAMGTFKELRENNVLDKEGGFLGIGKNKILKQDFNEDYFTELDIRETDIIPLNAKKAEVISDHASKSYRFVYQDDLISYLKIEDPAEFWKRTKYAIIEIRQ